MDWIVLTVFGILAIALITFLVMRNQKDEKEFEQQMNQDYHKSKEEEGDTEIDSVLK